MSAMTPINPKLAAMVQAWAKGPQHEPEIYQWHEGDEHLMNRRQRRRTEAAHRAAARLAQQPWPKSKRRKRGRK